jgi:hypothetical protein
MPSLPVSIDLKDDKQHTLLFKSRWLLQLERDGAKSIFDLLAHTEQIMTFNTAVSYLWAGLRHAEPGLTLDGAADLLDGYVSKGGLVSDIIVKLFEGLRESGFLGPETNGNGGAGEASRADPTRA